MNYTLALLKKEKISNTLTRFRFNKPASFTFNPGQFIMISFNSDSSDSHAFSISSSPQDEFLEVTVRKVGAFTSEMHESSPNTQFYISGPYGEFTLDKSRGEAVLIAGGVGVCPFLSMIRYSDFKNSKRKLTLIFSVKTKEDFLDKNVLDRISKENKNIKINYLTEFIDKKFILKTIKTTKNKTFYICGPPPMISLMKEILKSLKVKEGNIHVEEWWSIRKLAKAAKTGIH